MKPYSPIAVAALMRHLVDKARERRTTGGQSCGELAASYAPAAAG
jgi:hypothetical protein